MSTQPYPEGGQGSANNKSSTAPNSLLVADCGAVLTKVSLFGLVEGQYRLLARGEVPTTTRPPFEDITEGIIQATQTVEFITGRQLINGKQIVTPEQPSGDGIDAFVATVSAGEPLRVCVLGAITPELEKLAVQSVAGLYAQVQIIPSPSHVAATTPAAVGVGASPAAWTQERLSVEWERQLNMLREQRPQAALIIGSADGPAGPAPLQEACQLLISASREGALVPGGLASQDGSAPLLPVVYAGAPQYVEAVKRMLQGAGEVKRVDPLLSSAQLGPISSTLGALRERDCVHRLPGYERLRSWCGKDPIASAASLSSLIRFLSQHYGMNVTAVDVAGASTMVLLAGENGEFVPTVNTSVGVGTNIGAILQRVGLQRITRWLPFTIAEDEVRQFVLNHMLNPQALPTDARELALVQAFAREAILLTQESAVRGERLLSNADLILATGAVLSHAPKFGQIAMMLLDALQPRGVTSLVVDRSLLISELGAVALVAPVAAVQINENDGVSHRIGTCVIPFGDVRPGELAVRVGVEYSNGRQVSVDVMGGSIEVIPLQLNEQALLTLSPAPTVDVGLGPGERARAAEEIDGGLVGLIIDARGRPLVLPTDDTERQARLLQWSQVLGAN